MPNVKSKPNKWGGKREGSGRPRISATKRVTIAVSLPEDLVIKVKKEVHKRNKEGKGKVSVSELVRIAVEALLK